MLVCRFTNRLPRLVTPIAQRCGPTPVAVYRGNFGTDKEDQKITSKQQQQEGCRLSRPDKRSIWFDPFESDPVWDLFNYDPFETVPRRFFPKNAFQRSSGGWNPSIDISENENYYAVTADLPGVKKENLKVQVSNDQLVIEGERHFTQTQDEDKNSNVRRSERSFGKFVRRFSLPEMIDPEKIKASFKDGVLEIKLEKAVKSKAKVIEIESSA